MTAEDKLLLKRLTDLDHMADRKHMVCFSDFLNATEYSLFLEHRKEFFCSFSVFDQIEFLERQMIAFIPDALAFHNEFPIKLLKIQPKNAKFAQELTHRDVLGTLMGLSIERRLLGDIIFTDGCCYVLVKDQIAPFVCEEVERIRKTSVTVSVCENMALTFERKFEIKSGTVASSRLDCVVAEMVNLSRSQALKQIQEGLVFLNQRQVFHNATLCNAQDVISVRHVGKFQILEFGELTKKGKQKITYRIYC